MTRTLAGETAPSSARATHYDVGDMPWIDVREPYAAPPVVHEPTATELVHGPLGPDRDGSGFGDGGYSDGGYSDVVLDGNDVVVGPHAELLIESSIVRNVTLCPDHQVGLDSSWCVFSSCDLSRCDVRRLRASRLSDCKLLGTDFSDADVSDVIFERCVFNLASLRMARFRRVTFVDCVLREVDAFELSATDVSFEGSELDRVNVDRMNATRVDLRGARSLHLEAVGRLEGFLVTDDQLPGLVYQLAFAAGLGVEQTN